MIKTVAIGESRGCVFYTPNTKIKYHTLPDKAKVTQKAISY